MRSSGLQGKIWGMYVRILARLIGRGWLLALLGIMPLAQAAPVLLDDSSQHFPLTGLLEAFHDESGALTQQQVSSLQHQRQFVPLAHNFNAGYSPKGAWWLRVQLQAHPGSEEWWLQLRGQYIDHFEVWLPQADATGQIVLQQHSIGGRQVLAGRDMPWAIPALRLDSAALAQPQWIWMRVSGQRTLTVMGEVMTLPALGRDYQRITYQVATVIGMTLMMTLVSLVLGVTLPDRTFLWYSAYLGTSAVLFMCSENYLFALFLPEQPLLAARIHGTVMCLSLFTATVFAYTLLQMPQQFPRIAVVFRALAVLSLVCCVVAIAGGYGYIAMPLNLTRLLMSVVLIVLCAILVRRSGPGAWPNLMGFLVYGSTAILHFAKNLNWVPYTLVTHTSYTGGVVVHMIAIFLGLGLRVRSRERQALVDSQEAGARLERNVALRTQELREEMQQRESAQAELQKAMVEQRNFLSMVSHELRTPLAVIGASAEIIGDERFSANRNDMLLEAAKIGRAKQRMLGLVETLLADEWLNASAVQLHRSDIDLADLLMDRAEEHSFSSHREIRLDLPEGGLQANADERLLHIVFDNLIENARKYSPQGSAIEISARREGGNILVTVRDHGPGFTASDLQHVFERFWRAGTVLRKPGVGLGLYMVRRVVELHGGSVRAGNAASGGAEMIVTVPASPAQS